MALYAAFPRLRLHLRSDDDADRIELVRRGLADLAIVNPASVPNEMESKFIKPDRYFLVASASWKGRRLHDVLETERAIDFAEADETTARYLKAFDLRAPRPRLYVNENEALIRLFAAGIGFGTLTESVARPHLEKGSLITLNRGQAMEEPLALAWYPRTQRPDYFDALIRALR